MTYSLYDLFSNLIEYQFLNIDLVLGAYEGASEIHQVFFSV